MNQVPHSTKPQVSEESKLSAIKTLAIIGFIATTIVLVWLAVVIVRFIPEAFSSLASVFESVQSRRELHISVNRTIVPSGDTVTVSWQKTGVSGAYGFSYSCLDGVSASLQGSVIACDTWIPLSDSATSAEFLFTSEKRRFADVTLGVRFTPSEHRDADTKTILVTVVNESISTDGSVPETPELPATTTPETPEPVKPVTPKPVVPAYPVSNPNGYSDLMVTYIGVGTYNDSSKIFTLKSSLEGGERQALRFEVKNIGTKTSGTWSYQATLPTEWSDVYRSATQNVLLPGERSIVTVMFTPREKEGSASIDVEVSGGNDTRTGNNDFVKSVSISK